MRSNEIISYEPNTVTFYNDSLTAIKDNDGEIWALTNDILRNIGFDAVKISNQRKAWNNDIVISKGSKILPTLTNGGIQQSSCLNRRYIPLALAKISITPTMQREQPEVVDKLIRYQEECADVLYKYFYKSNELSNEIPLTREEMAMYWTNMMAALRDYTQILDRRDAERDEILNKIIANQAELYKSIALTQKLYQAISIDISNVVKGLVVNQNSSIVKPSATVTESPTQIIEKRTYTSKKSWVENAESRIVNLKSLSGKDRSVLSREIFRLMRASGCRIKTNPSIASIAGKKKYREVFECVMDELNKKYSSGEKKVSSGNYSAVIKMPPEMKSLIQEYATKKKISYKLATGRIYKLIEKTGHISLDKMLKDYCGRIGYANCSKSYMIYHNNELMDLFKKVMEA